MQEPNFVSKKTAPIQYILRQLNSDAGKVVRGWGTAPWMGLLMVLFFLFLLIILQIYNASIQLEGVAVDWSVLNNYVPFAEARHYGEGQFASTGLGVFLGLLVFAAGCIAFIIYGAITYPADRR